MNPEYLKEWSLTQVYEADAADIRGQIDGLERRYARVMDMVGQHRHRMALILELPEPPEAA